MGGLVANELFSSLSWQGMLGFGEEESRALDYEHSVRCLECCELLLRRPSSLEAKQLSHDTPCSTLKCRWGTLEATGAYPGGRMRSANGICGRHAVLS